jgi:transcriptional regulator with XRE-family HTH domain
MLKAHIGNPRNGVPSFRSLAERADVSVETVRQAILGTREPDDATVRALADALRVDVRKVSGWVGQTRTVRTPYEPPAEAGLLDQRERRAVDEVIRLLAASKRQAAEQPSRAEFGLAASDPETGRADGERRRPQSRGGKQAGPKSQ